jgi:hypothetical protein
MSRLISRMIAGRSPRSSGSPPVSRTFSTPRPTNARTILTSSSRVMSRPLGEERVVGPERLLGHAVRAAEIAPVRHGNAQVADGAAEGVAGAAMK